jgi:hypothetical protein
MIIIPICHHYLQNVAFISTVYESESAIGKLGESGSRNENTAIRRYFQAHYYEGLHIGVRAIRMVSYVANTF